MFFKTLYILYLCCISFACEQRLTCKECVDNECTYIIQHGGRTNCIESSSTAKGVVFKTRRELSCITAEKIGSSLKKNSVESSPQNATGENSMTAEVDPLQHERRVPTNNFFNNSAEQDVISTIFSTGSIAVEADPLQHEPHVSADVSLNNSLERGAINSSSSTNVITDQIELHQTTTDGFLNETRDWTSNTSTFSTQSISLTEFESPTEQSIITSGSTLTIDAEKEDNKFNRTKNYYYDLPVDAVVIVDETPPATTSVENDGGEQAFDAHKQNPLPEISEVVGPRNSELETSKPDMMRDVHDIDEGNRELYMSISNKDNTPVSTVSSNFLTVLIVAITSVVVLFGVLIATFIYLKNKRKLTPKPEYFEMQEIERDEVDLQSDNFSDIIL